MCACVCVCVGGVWSSGRWVVGWGRAWWWWRWEEGVVGVGVAVGVGVGGRWAVAGAGERGGVRGGVGCGGKVVGVVMMS